MYIYNVVMLMYRYELIDDIDLLMMHTWPTRVSRCLKSLLILFHHSIFFTGSKALLNCLNSIKYLHFFYLFLLKIYTCINPTYGYALKVLIIGVLRHIFKY